MISVAIPIFNAEKILLANYGIFKKQLGEIGQDYEILFLDDASCDASKDILSKIAASDSCVRLFSHSLNHGLGSCLKELFKSARGDIVIYSDIDLPFGIKILPELIDEIKGSDVILASRYLSRNGKFPLPRIIASRLYYLLCKALFGISVRDIGSGLVVFKKRVLDDIKLTARGFDIHIDIFSQLKKQGIAVREIPLAYNHNAYGSFSILKHGPRVLIDTLRLWIKKI